jgi:hypothetical protein
MVSGEPQFDLIWLQRNGRKPPNIHKIHWNLSKEILIYVSFIDTVSTLDYRVWVGELSKDVPSNESTGDPRKALRQAHKNFG